jgi:anti-sigma regulatory factor (Ser/Thr protein kinase)
MDRGFSRSFRPHPKAAAKARAALDASLHLFSDALGEEKLDDMRLLLSELVTNSVRHGGKQRRPIKLLVSVTASGVRVDVVDSGQGFDPNPREIEPHDDGGWGLFLLDQLADRWGVSEDGKTTVWFELDRNDRR